jgi:hypothetical protein
MSFIASFIYALLVLSAWVAALLSRNSWIANKQSIAIENAARAKADEAKAAKADEAAKAAKAKAGISTADALFKLAQRGDDGLYVHRQVPCRTYPYYH